MQVRVLLGGLGLVVREPLSGTTEYRWLTLTSLCSSADQSTALRRLGSVVRIHSWRLLSMRLVLLLSWLLVAWVVAAAVQGMLEYAHRAF